MRMDKLTSKFQSALSDAQSIALGADQSFIEPLHVMKALLNQAYFNERECECYKISWRTRCSIKSITPS
jgi:ATP-dependent Clp protease ATP-binding subunit ClpA